MRFIAYFRQDALIGTSKNKIGSVFVVGFGGTSTAFKKDLLKYPQFGFVTRKELDTWKELKTQSFTGVQADIDKAHDYGNKLKKRLSNRKNNGFFEFIGYKALTNRLFTTTSDVSSLNESEIRKGVADGTIEINTEYLDRFANSIIIGDEIHNVYNSIQKNNWGVALQIILDHHPSTRGVFMSATPINNNPSEIIDLLNLLLPPDSRVHRKDFFDKKTLKKGALDKIRELCTGRVSYLLEVNPKYFPSKKFLGTSIAGIPYLKFIRCKMSPAHEEAYMSAYDSKNKTLSQDSRYVIDFVLPNPKKNSKVGLFKSTDLRTIFNAPNTWKAKNNIDVVNGNVVGAFLRHSNLPNVSSKYTKMIDDVFNILRRRKGKMMIYHNYVNMSGAVFIQEIMEQNGIISEFGQSTDNTLCTKCGLSRKQHVDPDDVGDTDEKKKSKKRTSSKAKKSKKSHVFRPVRFIIIHSELDKKSIDNSISKYNRTSNNMGDDVMILIGSKIVKESYDLKCIQHMMIMSRPDNIPTVIQIMGRAVRKNSHAMLPVNMRHVNISIYVSSVRKGLSYEEHKYMDKMSDYKIIQNISKAFHENAVDAVVNRNVIMPGLSNKNLGDVKYEPTIKDRSLRPHNLNLDTFNTYHAHREIDMCTYIIKRAFVETSPAWKYKDLKEYVMRPEFDVEYDTTLIDECSIVVALSRLIWSPNSTTLMSKSHSHDSQVQSSSVVDKLFDTVDKRLYMPSGQVGVISQMGEFYILIPMVGGSVETYVDAPYRTRVVRDSARMGIIPYLEKMSGGLNFEPRLRSYYSKYKDMNIEGLSDAVCEYGIDFHVMFIERCIEYVFNSWTDWSTTKSEYHEFYFKMLYHYDILGLVIFAHTAKAFIYKIYTRYLTNTNPAKYTDKKINDAINNNKSATRDKQSILNDLARNISKNSCEWCPQITRELYDQSLSKSLQRFSIVKSAHKQKDIVPVSADLLPVGHFLQRVPKFYHPDRGWFASPEYIRDNTQWVENPIIIGYTTKSKTGIHMRFKLRKPVQFIKKFADARLSEKGSMCSTRSKPYLFDMCKKLGIQLPPGKPSITIMCSEIKARLMYLEMLERSNGTRVKYFYSHFEVFE
jgi:hypothetical protein